jgi:phage/plasmid-like protein (TIGR03299 family)
MNRSAFERAMQDVTQATSLSEALRMGDADFTVSKVTLHSAYIDNDGAGVVDFPKHRGIVRDDTHQPIAVMGSNYGVIQNHEAFAPLDYLKSEGLVSGFEQVGCLNNGGRVFVLANLASESTISGDPHVRRLMIATSHDGTGSVTAKGWLNRIVCSNQLPAIFSTRSKRGAGNMIAKIRHTSAARSYIAGFRSAVLSSIDVLNDTEQQIGYLMQREADASVVDRFITQMFPIKDESLLTQRYYTLSRGDKAIRTRVEEGRNALRYLIEAAPTQDNVRGTRAALLHAAVEYSDFQSSGKRAERILLGRDVTFKAKAFSLAGAL